VIEGKIGRKEGGAVHQKKGTGVIEKISSEIERTSKQIWKREIKRELKGGGSQRLVPKKEIMGGKRRGDQTKQTKKADADAEMEKKKRRKRIQAEGGEAC